MDLSKAYGGQKGNLTEKEVIKEILNKIYETVNNNEKIYNKIKNTISVLLKN